MSIEHENPHFSLEKQIESIYKANLNTFERVAELGKERQRSVIIIEKEKCFLFDRKDPITETTPCTPLTCKYANDYKPDTLPFPEESPTLGSLRQYNDDLFEKTFAKCRTRLKDEVRDECYKDILNVLYGIANVLAELDETIMSEEATQKEALALKKLIDQRRILAYTGLEDSTKRCTATIGCFSFMKKPVFTPVKISEPEDAHFLRSDGIVECEECENRPPAKVPFTFSSPKDHSWRKKDEKMGAEKAREIFHQGLNENGNNIFSPPSLNPFSSQNPTNFPFSGPVQPTQPAPPVRPFSFGGTLRDPTQPRDPKLPFAF